MIQPYNLKAILDTIEGKDLRGNQSIDVLIEYGFTLSQWIAYSGQQKAEVKQELHRKRKQAMINLVGTLRANGAAMPISLQKDYINDLCAEENYWYELADRCNSTCIHTLDFVRSAISALKQERQYSTQSQ